MSAAVVDSCSTEASLNDVSPCKTEVSDKEVWEQLTEEGTSSSDSDNESSLHLSGSDSEQSGHETDCISGLVSSSTSDNEQEAPVAVAPQVEAKVVQKVMCYPQQRVTSPQRRTRKAPLAEVLSSKLLQVSAGRPVKVWLSPDYKPMKSLDPSIPAKKRPAFPEHAGREKTLDPTLPVKKHLPAWLLKETFGDSTLTTKPVSPKPPKMPLRVPQAAQACLVAPTPR